MCDDAKGDLQIVTYLWCKEDTLRINGKLDEPEFFLMALFVKQTTHAEHTKREEIQYMYGISSRYCSLLNGLLIQKCHLQGLTVLCYH